MVKGVKVDGKHMSHLRFTDDIASFSTSRDERKEMGKALKRECRKMSLNMNISKTKYMTNIVETDDSQDFCIKREKIERVQECNYKYLGQTYPSSVGWKKSQGRGKGKGKRDKVSGE